jgi:hypothetical protein
MRYLWEKAHEPPELDMQLAREACAVAAQCAPYMHPRLASVDANIEIDTTAQLNDAERRERARQMILEAFAERQPLLPNGSVIEHEPIADMGESMGTVEAVDANQLVQKDK